MERIKLTTYKAGTGSVPALINGLLKEEYVNQTAEVLIFSQEDIIENAVDKNVLCNTYADFLLEWNIPFMTYAYYRKFNCVQPETDNRMNPKFFLKCLKGECDVVQQPAYGFLALNMNLLKEKKIMFDESYPEMFYVQDFAEKCYRDRLWVSNCFFLEIHDSANLFRTHVMENTYNIDFKKFGQEKERYGKTVNPKYGSPQEFVDRFKKWAAGERWWEEKKDPAADAAALPKSEIEKADTAVELIDLRKGEQK